MRLLILLYLFCLLVSCTTTKPSSNYSSEISKRSYANVLEAGEKLYAFRMPIDSISKCFFKNFTDSELINHYNNYQKENNADQKSEGVDAIGRKVTKRNIQGILSVGFNNQQGTKIVMRISIDRLGRVIAAEMLEQTTAKLSQVKRREVLAQVLFYQYEIKEDAPCIESGILTINLTNIRRLK